MMTEEGLTNTFVEQVANIVQPNYYIHVVSCEDLIEKFDTHFEDEHSIIINSALRSQTSGHFALFHIRPETREIRVYCSLNMILRDQNVANYVKNVRKAHPDFTFETSPFQGQSFLSSMCGVWALSFLASTTKAGGQLSMEKFYSKFSKIDLVKNDRICLRYLLDFILHKLYKH